MGDTENRFSLISYQQPWNVPIPISTDGLGQGDKQHLLWGYAGINWTSISANLKAGYYYRILMQEDL